MDCKLKGSCVLVKTAHYTRWSPVVTLDSRFGGPGCTSPGHANGSENLSNRCWQALLVLATSLGTAACDSTKPLPPAVLVTPASLTLEDGQSAKVTATLRNPKSRSVRWSTSNAGVATVDLVGNVTAVSNGSAVITVKMSDDTTVLNTVPVTVSGPAIGSIVVLPANATIYVNALSLRLSVGLRAADGRVIRGREVTFASPDANIADVTSTGIVRGRAPGGPIEVTVSAEGRTGTSRIRVAHAAELCPVITPIGFGQGVTGVLALGDCEFSLDDSYVDVYEFTLPTAATVQIDMTSTDVDSYIGLFESNGVFIGEDDNSGGGRDSRLVKQLNAGRYRIWANTITGGVSGAYSIVVTQRASSAGFVESSATPAGKFRAR